MKLKRKSAEIEAFKLVEDGALSLISGSSFQFKKGDWLVNKDGKLFVMTENELRKDYDFPTTSWKKPRKRVHVTVNHLSKGSQPEEEESQPQE